MRNVTCGECRGAGCERCSSQGAFLVPDEPTTCPACNGKGLISRVVIYNATEGFASADHYVAAEWPVEETCPTCNGTGRV